jgi:HTH-type transcriptional regulator/antitoxin HigA
MTKDSIIPIEHPGVFIAEELDAREWKQADLAYILGMNVTQLNKLINGERNITPKVAIELGDAFDMPPQFFMNLQSEFDIYKSKSKEIDSGVGKRARLSVFPIRDMINRGWIEDSDPALLDLQIMRFFNKDKLEDVPFIGDANLLAHAAKKLSYDNTTPIQYAWLYRVRKIAESIDCPAYSKAKLENSLNDIRAHMLDIDDFIHIPEILRQCGVRFVLVESLPGSKIDGVCLWLDNQPVIGMTLRLNRADNFCFVLRHEIEHVLREDGKDMTFAPIDEIDEKQENDERPECELLADKAAAEFCVPRNLLDSFIARKSPFISERDVLNFAARVEINASVVVGQIQNATKKWGWLRKHQVNIQDKLLDWDFKDGWGYSAPTGL